MPFSLETYSIADFIEWNRNNRLRLNPDFQRRDAWSPAEKTLLIDTVLRGLSMPKVYFRTVIDPVSQGMVRDVVDGQQRLRSIIAFANNELKLGKKAEEYEGKRYRDLTDEEKQNFLQYRISTEQLMNASDFDVVFIFTRLNQYGARLNQAELRNAEFDNALKWLVVETSGKWWKDLLANGFISLKQRSRMIDDEIVAELAQIHLKGVQGGDARSLRKLYEDGGKIDKDGIKDKIDCILDIVLNRLGPYIPDNIKSRPHFVVLYAAIAEVVYGIPNGASYRQPGCTYGLPESTEELIEFQTQLVEISDVIASEDYPGEDWEAFYNASRSAPINVRSRTTRFPIYLELFKNENNQANQII